MAQQGSQNRGGAQKKEIASHQTSERLLSYSRLSGPGFFASFREPAARCCARPQQNYYCTPNTNPRRARSRGQSARSGVSSGSSPLASKSRWRKRGGATIRRCRRRLRSHTTVPRWMRSCVFQPMRRASARAQIKSMKKMAFTCVH